MIEVCACVHEDLPTQDARAVASGTPQIADNIASLLIGNEHALRVSTVEGFWRRLIQSGLSDKAVIRVVGEAVRAAALVRPAVLVRAAVLVRPAVLVRAAVLHTPSTPCVWLKNALRDREL
jgi:hypothetical protein